MTPMRSSKDVYTMLSLPVIALCFLALPGSTKGGLASAKLAAVEPVAVATVVFDVCITDGTSHNTLQFSSTTGAYSFTRCKDSFTLSGTGTVRKSGSIIVLNDKKSDRVINVNFIANQKTGKATVIRILGKGTTQTITLNQTSPTQVCGCPV